MYSPGMFGTSGTDSRSAASANQELDREVEAIAVVIVQEGDTGESELAESLHAPGWGPGRFRAALRQAILEGRIKPISGDRYGPPD